MESRRILALMSHVTIITKSLSVYLRSATFRQNLSFVPIFLHGIVGQGQLQYNILLQAWSHSLNHMNTKLPCINNYHMCVKLPYYYMGFLPTSLSGLLAFHISKRQEAPGTRLGVLQYWLKLLSEST